MADYSGIWQDENKPDHYYSIHQTSDALVLIDLSQLETVGQTLKASYSGHFYGDAPAHFLLDVFSKNDNFLDKMRLDFKSELEGFLSPYIEPEPRYDVFVIYLRKIM